MSHPASRSTVGVAVIGAGVMARGNARVLAQHPNVHITGVLSRSGSSARQLVADLDVDGASPRVYADLGQLLDDDTVDMVVVTTPDSSHAEIVVRAAQSGRHVLCEKPLATTLADADAMVEAVRSAGVTAMCLFNHRWVPAYAQAKDLVAELGPAVVGYARKNDTIFVPTEMIPAWAAETTPAWFLSCHDIDLMTWLVGSPIVRVSAVARRGLLERHGIDTPDAVQIQAEFDNGAMATFESAWIYPNTFPTMVDSYITLTCEEGVIQVDRQSESISVATASGFRYPRNMLQRKVHGVEAGAYRDAIHHFVDCVVTGAEPLITIESSRDVTAALEAAHRSIESGRPELVPVREVGGSPRQGGEIQ